MGGRGASAGGVGLGNGSSGVEVNVKSSTDLVSEREGNPRSVDETLSVLRDVNEEYGYIIKNTVVADIGKSPAVAYYEEGTGLIGVNKNYFDADKMNASYEKSVSQGWHPSNGNKTGTEAVISHEVGHALTEEAAKKNNMSFDSMSEKIVKESLKAKTKSAAVEKANRISGYAKTNNSECIAEAFADVYCNGKNAKAESHSVVNTLNKYLK